MCGIYLRPFLRGPALFPAPPPPGQSMVAGRWPGAVGNAALTVGTPAKVGAIRGGWRRLSPASKTPNCPPAVELRQIAVLSVKVTETTSKQAQNKPLNATKIKFGCVRAYFAASLARGSSPPKEILISTGPVCLLSWSVHFTPSPWSCFRAKIARLVS